MKKITSETVRADFNDLQSVVHYTRAAHELGLWASERALIERFFPDRSARLLEAGCGAGRVTIGLWQLGYRTLTAFDFALELIDQARSLAAERRADAITFVHADATDLSTCHPLDDKSRTAGEGSSQASCHPLDDKSGMTGDGSSRASCHPMDDNPRALQPATGKTVCHLMDDKSFHGALFMFNGLMQIPGRERRRTALRELHRVCAPGAPLLFTTHDRDSSPMEQAMWRLETLRWTRGEQDPRLLEFGDRYFEDEAGRTFMHLPDRREILEDLAATGWRHAFDALRKEVAKESRAVRDFSDECRFWAAHRGE